MPQAISCLKNHQYCNRKAAYKLWTYIRIAFMCIVRSDIEVVKGTVDVVTVRAKHLPKITQNTPGSNLKAKGCVKLKGYRHEKTVHGELKGLIYGTCLNS